MYVRLLPFVDREKYHYARTERMNHDARCRAPQSPQILRQIYANIIISRHRTLRSHKTYTWHRVRCLFCCPNHSITPIARYKFARRSNAADGSMKDIAHIWEIAGGLASLDLLKVMHHNLRNYPTYLMHLQVPLTVQSAASSAIAIVTSLARPAGVFASTRAILERVKEMISAIDAEARMAAGDKRRSPLEKAREKVLSKLADHPDAKEKRILVCGVCVPPFLSNPNASRFRALNSCNTTASNRRHMHALRHRAAKGARGAESTVKEHARIVPHA
jgi:hypothetical protein